MAEVAPPLDGMLIAVAFTSSSSTGTLVKYYRNAAHASGALVEHEKPSPPPSAAPGSPLPPVIDGNGKKPISPSTVACWAVGTSPMIVGISQSPCSSIAALPLATRPAELPAPCWAGVARKPVLKGFASSSFFRSSPALTKHGSVNLAA